jgi:hypothetical protein
VPPKKLVEVGSKATKPAQFKMLVEVVLLQVDVYKSASTHQLELHQVILAELPEANSNSDK